MIGGEGQFSHFSELEAIGRVGMYAEGDIGNAIFDQIEVSRGRTQCRQHLDFDAAFGGFFNIGGPRLNHFCNHMVRWWQPVRKAPNGLSLRRKSNAAKCSD